MKNKYNAKRCMVVDTDDVVGEVHFFDSMGERDYWYQLKWEEKKGKHIVWDTHPTIELTRAKVKYKPDFLIIENGKKVYIDFKGYGKMSSRFPTIKKLWKVYGDGELRVVKKRGKNFYIKETIESIGQGTA